MDTRSDVERYGLEPPPRYGSPQEEMKLLQDLQTYFRAYARERPEIVALTCLAAGFLLGWKLKPW